MSDTEREGVTFACEDCGSRVEDAPMRPATCVECGGAFEVVQDDDVDLPLLLRSVDRGDGVRLRKEDGSFVRGDVRRIWHEAEEDEVRLTLSGDGQASYEVRADAGDRMATVTVAKVMGSGESAVRAGRDRVVGVLNLADHPDTLDDHRGERVALVGCGQKKASHPVPARQLYESAYFDKKHQYAEQEAVDTWYILSAEYGFVHPDERIEPYDTHIDDVDADEWCRLVQQQMPHLDGSTVKVLAGEAYFEALDLALDFAVGTDGAVERPLEGLGIGEQMAWLKEHTGDEDAEQTIFKVGCPTCEVVFLTPEPHIDCPDCGKKTLDRLGFVGARDLAERVEAADLPEKVDPSRLDAETAREVLERVEEGDADDTDERDLPTRVNGWMWCYEDWYLGKTDLVDMDPWVTAVIIEQGDEYVVTVDGGGKTEPIGLVETDDRETALDELLVFVRETAPDAARAAIDPRVDVEWGTFEVPEQPDDTNFECEDCGHRERLNSDVDVRWQSCAECGGDMILDGVDADTTEQATLAPAEDDNLQEEEHDDDLDGCVALIRTTGKPCGNSVTTEASDTAARLCGNHAKASSVSRADAVEGSPDPDLRDQLVDAGMNGSHAYYLATLTDSAEMLWHIVTDASEIGGGEVTYDATTLATLAPTVARLDEVDAEGHPLAYDGCVAVIDSGARGEDYRCGSGSYAHKLLCGLHQDTNIENLRTVFDEDAPDDLRIDAWPEVSIGDDRFLAVEQRDGDLLAISIPDYEYRRLEGFGYLVDELEDAGAGDDSEGKQNLTDEAERILQEPSSEEIEAEPEPEADTEADDAEERDRLEQYLRDNYATHIGTDGGTQILMETFDTIEEFEAATFEKKLRAAGVRAPALNVILDEYDSVVDLQYRARSSPALTKHDGVGQDTAHRVGKCFLKWSSMGDAPPRAWNGIHSESPEIAPEDDSAEEPVDRQSAREQVLEELVPLLEAGLSPSQALDYWATEDAEETHGAFTQQEWAEIRDVSRQAIGGNAGKAREALDEEAE